jgi:hypothetical protein
MNVINTTAPIPIELLKTYFSNPETKFVIDYKESSLKNSKLLIYLSNLDIPADIHFEDTSDFLSLLKDYLESSFLLNIDSLEKATISALLTHKEIHVDDKYVEFVKENTELLERWSKKLDSLMVYNLYIVDSEEIKKLTDVYEKDESAELEGINFVSLLKHEDFYVFYEKIKESNLKFYQSYFNDYMFKGKNLYSFWANNNNPAFLLTFGVAAGIDIKDYMVEQESL